MAAKRTRKRPTASESVARYLRDVKANRVDDPVTAYALAVTDGRIVAGPWVRLAGVRHLRDLERDDVVWDLEAATHVIRFFPSVLRLAEDQPFELQPWQQFIVGSIFGWKRLDDTRRFRTANIEAGKGCGKTPLAAGIGHFMTVADGEPRAEVYAAATKKEQAQIMFRDAVAMRDLSPGLTRRLQTSGKPPLVWNLLDQKTGSFFRPLSSDRKQSGARVHCALVDELHEHEDRTVVDLLRAGRKGRRQPLIFEITNSGFDRTTVCWDHHDYSLRVLQGMHDDDTWFAYVCALDEGDDWTDEAVWLKTEPNLGISIQPEYLRDIVNEALGMPSIQNVTRRLYFCEWTAAESIGIPPDQWTAAAAPFDASAFAGEPCFLGLDLSATQDLTAARFLFPAAEGRKARTLGLFWIPEEDLANRCRRDKAPYDQWIREGWLRAIPGNVIRYDRILADIFELVERHQLRILEAAVDPYGAMNVMNQLADAGLSVVVMQQSFTMLSPPTKELLRLLAGREIEHDGNPVCTWNAANATIEQRADGSIRFDKQRSTGRIDGLAALVNAIDRASRHNMIPTVSVYELYEWSNGGSATPPKQSDDQQTAPEPPADATTTGAPAARPPARRSVYESDEWTKHREELGK